MYFLERASPLATALTKPIRVVHLQFLRICYHIVPLTTLPLLTMLKRPHPSWMAPSTRMKALLATASVSQQSSRVVHIHFFACSFLSSFFLFYFRNPSIIFSEKERFKKKKNELGMLQTMQYNDNDHHHQFTITTTRGRYIHTHTHAHTHTHTNTHKNVLDPIHHAADWSDSGTATNANNGEGQTANLSDSENGTSSRSRLSMELTKVVSLRSENVRKCKF